MGIGNGSALSEEGSTRVDERKVDTMAEPREARRHIERLIERTQDEILEASRELAEGINKGTERFVPPISMDIERMVDDVFDFAERVIQGQRRMVNEVVKTINEQTDRDADVGRVTTQKAAKRVARAKKVVAKKNVAKKAPAKKTTVAKKKAAKKAPVTKAKTGR
jgi:hypothetical protein